MRREDCCDEGCGDGGGDAGSGCGDGNDGGNGGADLDPTLSTWRFFWPLVPATGRRLIMPHC